MMCSLITIQTDIDNDKLIMMTEALSTALRNHVAKWLLKLNYFFKTGWKYSKIKKEKDDTSHTHSRCINIVMQKTQYQWFPNVNFHHQQRTNRRWHASITTHNTANVMAKPNVLEDVCCCHLSQWHVAYFACPILFFWMVFWQNCD